MEKYLTQEFIYMLSVPIHATAIIGEMIYSYFLKRKLYTVGDTATNVYVALFNFGLDLLMKGASFAIMLFFYYYRIFDLEFTLWYWIGVFILQDFAYYVQHYVDHYSRFFWAVHVTHHNSEYFNISTGFRASVFQPLYRYLFFCPLALVGFHPLHVMAAYAILQIYGTLVHTESVKKMGFLEWILVTPSHHRVHHASNGKYLDKNMGMFLIIWDRMFGTFQKEEDDYEPITYGLTSKLEDKGPINIVFHEWKSIWNDVKRSDINWSQRLKYVFYPPGWSHDGSRKTSKQIQQEIKEKAK
ncbi:sterol desaturase family protein [Kordia sp.]|uniref:sterol desaturase family protein n=1 Tax=Kordia sp. TaxID=1965332 RepID=UPI003B5A9A16